MSHKFFVDIEVYDKNADKWAQAAYLAHGYSDIHWTDDLDSALNFLKPQIIEAEEELNI